MWKKIFTLFLALTVAFPLIACGEEAAEEEKLPSTQAIVDSVIESLDDIRTYQFDVDMTMNVTSESEDEAIEATKVMGFSGALDLENKQMRMDITMNTAGTGGEEPEAERVYLEVYFEVYLVADMVYMMMEVPEEGPQWMKLEIPEGYWEQISQTQAQVELLRTARVEMIGSENVGGVNCYVLQLTPDMEQLWQLTMQQQGVIGGEMPDIAEEHLQEIFRSFSVKQWVAKDTYLLTKAEIDMVMELTPEAMGYPEEEGVVTMDITMTFLAYNYNQPISIALPEEAEEAMEVPKLFQ